LVCWLSFLHRHSDGIPSPDWILHFRYGEPVYVEFFVSGKRKCLESEIETDFGVLFALLKRLPTTLEKEYSIVFPGSICQCLGSYYEELPLIVSIHYKYFSPLPQFAAFALQNWRGLILIGTDEVRREIVRSLVYWLSENPQHRVLMVDPKRFVAHGSWDVAGFAPRAVGCGLDFKLAPILDLVRRMTATHVVLCRCEGSLQIPLANGLLANGIRVIYDAYPYDEIGNLEIHPEEQVRIGKDKKTMNSKFDSLAPNLA
jgi:hypothetical protein